MAKLAKKEAGFIWRQAQQETIKKIMAIVLESIMLAFPEINQPFILYTPARNTQLGSHLAQVHQNTTEEKTIATLSWKLNSAQLNYPIMEKELLDIMESIKNFHNIIYITAILVQIYHENNCHKMQNIKVNKSFVSVFLSQEYKTKNEHHEGKKIPKLMVFSTFNIYHRLKFTPWNLF